METKPKSQDGALGIELKVADAAGRLTEVMVDVATGKVMPVDHDGEASEEHED